MAGSSVFSRRAEVEARVASSASPRARGAADGCGESTSGMWRHITFDNLPFSDARERVEHTVKSLDVVAALLTAQAVAAEEHAKAALTSAAALATQFGPAGVGTGQGVSKSIDGARGRPTSVVESLSSFSVSGLFGAKAPPKGAVTSLADVGNGSSTLHGALKRWAAALTAQATARGDTGLRLRTEADMLKRLRAARVETIEPQLLRGNARIADTQAKAKLCDAAQVRIDRARRALADADGALQAHSRLSGANPAHQQELMKYVGAAAGELEQAQTAIMATTEGLVAARRRRDEELTIVARALQAYDDSCQAALVRAVASVAGTASDDASASLLLSHALSEAAGTVSLRSDARTFLYHRRIALLLQENILRIDAKSGAAPGPGGSGGFGEAPGSEDGSIVPQPMPVSKAVRHHREFLEADTALAPVMSSWVAAIFAGTGRERWPEEEATAAGEEEVFDVANLAEHAARIALLKSLNQQRSVEKNVGAAFNRLATVMWLLLDAADAQEDVCCSRGAMIMAETFYRHAEAEESSSSEGGGGSSESSRRERVFLQSILRRHAIWKREGLWEEIFYESLYEALKANGAAALSATGRSGSTSPSCGTPGGRPGTADFNAAYAHTVMSNLAAVVMNMATFGVEPSIGTRTVMGLARANGLSAANTAELLAVLAAQ